MLSHIVLLPSCHLLSTSYLCSAVALAIGSRAIILTIPWGHDEHGDSVPQRKFRTIPMSPSLMTPSCFGTRRLRQLRLLCGSSIAFFVWSSVGGDLSNTPCEKCPPACAAWCRDQARAWHGTECSETFSAGTKVPSDCFVSRVTPLPP